MQILDIIWNFLLFNCNLEFIDIFNGTEYQIVTTNAFPFNIPINDRNFQIFQIRFQKMTNNFARNFQKILINLCKVWLI